MVFIKRYRNIIILEEIKITFSEKTEKDIIKIADLFRPNEEEFVEEAVTEEILELKKQIFFNITDHVGAALRSATQMLKEFEEARE